MRGVTSWQIDTREGRGQLKGRGRKEGRRKTMQGERKERKKKKKEEDVSSASTDTWASFYDPMSDLLCKFPLRPSFRPFRFSDQRQQVLCQNRHPSGPSLPPCCCCGVDDERTGLRLSGLMVAISPILLSFFALDGLMTSFMIPKQEKERT